MEPTEENLRAWEAVHRRRGDEPRGAGGLSEHVRRSLGELKGKRVLHLQCGDGGATLELVRLGALVTAVDASEQTFAAARDAAPSVVWIEADVHDLPSQLKRGRFDLVYTGDGALATLRDLDAWAHGIEAALKRGGDLLLFDDHPIAGCVDALLHWREDYFEGRWRLGHVVSAVARSGLTVKALEEYPPHARARRPDARVPAAFLLHARKES